MAARAAPVPSAQELRKKLLAVRPRLLRETVYRGFRYDAWVRFGAHPLDGAHSGRVGGRYNPPGSPPTLYTATSRLCVGLEMEQESLVTGLPKPDRSVMEILPIDVAIGVLDLTSGSVLKALGIKSEALVQPSESWRNPASSGGLPLTQRIGAAARQRFSGILAPSWLATVVASSAVPLVNLVLFLSGPPDWQPMSGRVDLRAPPGRYG